MYMAERESEKSPFTIVRKSAQTLPFLGFLLHFRLLRFAEIRYYPACIVGKIVGKEWAELQSD